MTSSKKSKRAVEKMEKYFFVNSAKNSFKNFPKEFSKKKKIAGFKMYSLTKQKMKFCTKCHKRVVEKIESNIELSLGHSKICVCRGQGIKPIHGSVIKRLVSEMGVHEVKKITK